MRIYAPPERKYSTWVGGSVLSSLASFRKLWVSREEYEEEGVRAVHRRAL